MTKIIKCNCGHHYQDKAYGPGMRVHNRTEKRKGVSATYYRCTVCGALK